MRFKFTTPEQLRRGWFLKILPTFIFIVSAFGLNLLSWTLVPSKVASLVKLTPLLPKLNPSIIGLGYGLVTTGLYLGYFGIIGQVKNKQVSRRSVWTLITLISTIFLLGYPAFSKDIFNYTFTAKIVTLYRHNPYQTAPAYFSNDPWLDLINWQKLTTPYGPIWIALSLIPSLLAQSRFLTSLFLFKILVFGFHLGVLGLIQTLAKKINSVDPLYCLSLYALNPLVLLETLLNGHNDVVMVFLMLIGFWFLESQHLIRSIGFWILSWLTKKVTLVLLPLYLLIIAAKRSTGKLGLIKALKMASCLLVTVFLLSPFRRELNLPQEPHPWYLVWFFPLLILVGDPKVIKAVLLTSFLLMLFYLPDLAGLGTLTIWTTLVFREIALIGIAVFIYLLGQQLQAVLKLKRVDLER